MQIITMYLRATSVKATLVDEWNQTVSVLPALTRGLRAELVLKLLDENLECFGCAGLRNVVALDDCFVGVNSADGIVGFDGKYLLKGVCRAVSFESPDFHFTETLAAELRFTAEGLLGNE